MKKSRGLLGLLLVLFVLSLVSLSLLIGSSNKNQDGDKQITVGVIYMTMNNPYFEVINREIETIVAGNGDVLITRDSNMDSSMQIRLMDRMIEDKVDIILVNAVDWKAITPALEDARDAGIPVIALDTEVYEDDLVFATITSNNYEAGSIIARDLMTKRTEGNLLLLVQSENKAARDRIRGLLNTLDLSHWKYNVVDRLECSGQLEIAQPLVEKVLNRTTDIDVVVALNDPSAMGAMAALDARNMLSDVLVYGVDGAPEAKTMIYEGNMTGTVAQSPTRTGRIAASMIYNILEGRNIIRENVVPVFLITQDNISDYSLSNWE